MSHDCRRTAKRPRLGGVVWVAAIAVAVVSQAAGLIVGGPPPGKAAPPTDNKAYEASLRAELDGLREQLATAASPGDLTPSANQLLDKVIAFAIPSSDASLFRDINALRRSIHQLGALKPEDVGPTRKVVAANPVLARAVGNAIGPRDNAAGAYAVLRLLAEKFPERVLDEQVGSKGAGTAEPGKPRAQPKTKKGVDLSNLVAAFCIVYDGPADGEPAKLDEDRVAALFDYFSTNATRLTFGPATSPELLAFVVDPDPFVTIEDLNWALKSYAGNKTVGKLYKTIVYDTAHFKHGTPKKIEKAPGGVTLQNIRKFGGVCVEQAQFATNVGKAIGVPTAFVVGRGSDVGHAWVGYLKSAGSGKYAWDFNEGRYDEYEDLRGSVRDPRTGAVVPDGYVGLTAGLAFTGAGGSTVALAAAEGGREDATAMFDAAKRIAAIEDAKVAYPPPSGTGPAPTTTLRPLGINTQLELVEMGLRKSPSNRRGWEMIAAIAGNRRLSPEQLKTWSERVIELCGNDYPDFAFDALSPMIRAVVDAEEQDRLWEWAAGRFNTRKDLAAAAILARGDLWVAKQEPRKGWEFYHDVIERYANDGMIILDALTKAETLLTKENKAEQIIPLYQGAWSRITKPKMMATEFTRGSSYVLVGRKYAELLEKGGKPIDAAKVRGAIKEVLEK